MDPAQLSGRPLPPVAQLWESRTETLDVKTAFSMRETGAVSSGLAPAMLSGEDSPPCRVDPSPNQMQHNYRNRPCLSISNLVRMHCEELMSRRGVQRFVSYRSAPPCRSRTPMDGRTTFRRTVQPSREARDRALFSALRLGRLRAFFYEDLSPGLGVSFTGRCLLPFPLGSATRGRFFVHPIQDG